MVGFFESQKIKKKEKKNKKKDFLCYLRNQTGDPLHLSQRATPLDNDAHDF